MTRLAVLGHPVAHSRSPAMQLAALRACGLGDWDYEALDVPPAELESLLDGMWTMGFVGANVTIPHKQAALAFSSTASERAREIGAANTLSFADGEIAAENTDAPGVVAAIEGLTGEPLGAGRGPALVLGAGGAARAVVWALGEAGLEVAIWNRTHERAERLAAELGGGAEQDPECGRFGLIVNTTPVGLGADGSPDAGGEGDLKGFPLDSDGLGDRQVVVDLAYGITDTPLIAAAKAAGSACVDGIEILVRQGAESFQIWTGKQPPLDVMRRAARAGLTDNGLSTDTPPGSSPGRI